MVFEDKSEKIDLNKLAEIWSPFKSNIWVKLTSPITKEEITKALEENNFQSPDVEVCHDLIWDISDRETHIKRIAWFVKNLDSEKYPIEIDFGIPNLNLGFFEIYDGNHRLLAAYYREDKFIHVYCSGAVDEIKKYSYTEN